MPARVLLASLIFYERPNKKIMAEADVINNDTNISTPVLLGPQLADMLTAAFAKNAFVDLTPFTLDLQNMKDAECQRLMRRVLVHARKTNTVPMTQRVLDPLHCTTNPDLLICILLCIHHTYS
jgi:hypothetical protein